MVYNDTTKYINSIKGKRMKLVHLITAIGLSTTLVGCALTPPPPPMPDENSVMTPINPQKITEAQIKTVLDEHRYIPVEDHLEGLTQ